jgi:hypothetical protein
MLVLQWRENKMAKPQRQRDRPDEPTPMASQSFTPMASQSLMPKIETKPQEQTNTNSLGTS